MAVVADGAGPAAASAGTLAGAPDPGAPAIGLVRLRAFVALRLDDAIRARLAEAVERLRPDLRDVAWVAADDVHVTLKFLGAVEAARVDAITAELASALAGVPAFDLVVSGLGAYPSAEHPRVLWAGVGEGAEATVRLAGRIDTALVSLGFEREGRPFSPHVTLGRVRRPRRDARLAAALDAGATFGRQRVARASLMRSDLSARGARYTELAALPLQASG
jgi:2'-5' RNA ligase